MANDNKSRSEQNVNHGSFGGVKNEVTLMQASHCPEVDARGTHY